MNSEQYAGVVIVGPYKGVHMISSRPIYDYAEMNVPPVADLFGGDFSIQPEAVRSMKLTHHAVSRDKERNVSNGFWVPQEWGTQDVYNYLATAVLRHVEAENDEIAYR